MKRNISINIRGIIFNIEEDTYPLLKDYLNSINKYFSSYEDSREILEDIEGRIAEIFYSKLNKQKQVITHADVEELMQIMGNVDDFQNAEMDPAFQTTFQPSDLEIPTEDDFGGGHTAVQVRKPKVIIEEPPEEFEKFKEPAPLYADSRSTSWEEEIPEEKKLYRDTQRRLIGGVAAGLAHYFNMDPIWVRLLFILLITGAFFLPAAPITAVILYGALWALVPQNDQLEENPKIKKLFRDPERAVFGGVAAGLATYLGVNEMVIRVAFILLNVTGIFLYLILLIIIPEARTLTQKMQMEGEAINLQNIQMALRRNLNLEEGEEINTLSRIFLFPFQVASLILGRIARVLRPYVSFAGEAIRFGGGTVLLIMASLLSLAWTACLIAMQGWGVENALHIDNIPGFIIRNSFDFSPLMLINAYITFMIPTFFLGLFGFMMLRRKVYWNHKIAWSLIAIWLFSATGTGVSAGMIAQEFSQIAEVPSTLRFDMDEEPMLISLNENSEGNFEAPSLKVVGYAGKDVKLVKRFQAYGKSRSQAAKNAQMLSYHVEQQGASLIFDHYTQYKKGGLFRRQSLDLELYIPYEKTFQLSNEMGQLLYNTLAPYNYEDHDLASQQWKFTQDQLICITCSQQTPPDLSESEFHTEGNFRAYDLSNFWNVEMSGIVHMSIRKGSEYSVKAIGEPQDLKYLLLEQHGNTLEILTKNRQGNFSKNHPLKVEITMPELRSLDMNGATRAEVYGLVQPKLTVDMNGATYVQFLDSKINTLKAEISGASHLDAFSLVSENANIEISGASRASLFVTNKLDAEASGTSSITYKGDPNSVSGNTSGISSISRD